MPVVDEARQGCFREEAYGAAALVEENCSCTGKKKTWAVVYMDSERSEDVSLKKKRYYTLTC